MVSLWRGCQGIYSPAINIGLVLTLKSGQPPALLDPVSPTIVFFWWAPVTVSLDLRCLGLMVFLNPSVSYQWRRLCWWNSLSGVCGGDLQWTSCPSEAWKTYSSFLKFGIKKFTSHRHRTQISFVSCCICFISNNNNTLISVLYFYFLWAPNLRRQGKSSTPIGKYELWFFGDGTLNIW